MESKVVEVTLKQGELIVYLGMTVSATSNWWGNKKNSQTIIDNLFFGAAKSEANPAETL